MKKEKPIIYFAITYLILVVSLHLIISIWGDYKVKALNENNKEIIIEKTGDELADEIGDSIERLGNDAKRTIYKILVFFFGDLITMVALLLPNYIREHVDKWVKNYGCKELDWETFNKYMTITLIINFVLFVIDLMSVFNEASIYMGLLNG